MPSLRPFRAIPFAARLARRELRGGFKGLGIFLASLTLGVAAIAGVGSLSSGIQEGLRTNAQVLLGGDVELRVVGRGLETAAVSYLGDLSAAVAPLREMRAMARAMVGDQRMLVELKGVSASYPLFGAVELSPPQALADALAERDGRRGAVAEPALLTRLGMALGGTVKVGDALFDIRAVIVREPDRIANAFSLGPRLMVSDAGFSATGLVREGSLIRYLYRVRLAPGASLESWLGALHTAFPDRGWRIRDTRDSQPSVRRFIDRFGVFLTLVGVATLLVGGIGVGNAVQNYLSGRTETIAILKCLGAPCGLIFRVYLIEIGLLSALGVALGLMLGALTPYLANVVLAGSLPVAAATGVYPQALALAAAFGFLVAAVFALWPLGRASVVPVAVLFRQTVEVARRPPRPAHVLAVGVAVGLLALLATFGSGEPSVAKWFVLGAAGALLAFRGAAALLVRGVRALDRPSGAGVRLALANICRPGAPTAGVVVSLGAGLTVLVAVALIEGNLARQIRDRISDQAPAFFFIDIQPDQAVDFDATVRAVPGAGGLERVPMLRGRITLIDGTPPSEAVVAREAQWVLRHELGITYARGMPARTQLVAGNWWPMDYDGPPAISLDADIARGMNLGIGDTMTFTVLGRRITATIYNLRRIDWMDIGINFFVVFAPDALEAAPQTYLATARVTPDAEDALFRAVTDRFPNVSPIRVRDVIDSISEVLERIATGTRATASLALIAGILVLAGAVAAGHRRRVYDAVILKVLGATRAVIFRAYVLEYALLGLATGLIAAATGTLAAWVVVTEVMHGEWVFMPWSVAATVLLGVFVTAAFGFLGTWRALGQKAAPVLRTE